ncbi:glycoside hydrolase family 125 protein [Streptomyces sp. NPDC057616]|uniref:glycoside hydrolase family 125 protein n=1 Tax=Streptomyces sp. NPDC057616 TaxID=3346183 RepID=UPI00368DB7FE
MARDVDGATILVTSPHGGSSSPRPIRPGVARESFHKDDPRRFTRPWFSWANAMYAELALDVS